jgi:hypothetical protein
MVKIEEFAWQYLKIKTGQPAFFNADPVTFMLNCPRAKKKAPNFDSLAVTSTAQSALIHIFFHPTNGITIAIAYFNFFANVMISRYFLIT